MKRAILFFCGLLAAQMIWAITPEEIISRPEIRIGTYREEIVSGKIMRLAMPYGKPLILNEEQLDVLKDATVAQIDLVYSDFPKDADLTALNLDRLKNFQLLQPSLFQQPEIRWNVVRQTNCGSREKASTLFHGLVIMYRPVQSTREIAKEIAEIKKLTKRNGGAIARVAEKSATITISKDLSPATKSKLLADERDSVYDVAIGDYSGLPKYEFPPAGFKDTTVSAVLNRNKWNNMLVVADVTGSMYPFTSQLLIWLQLNTAKKQTIRYVFFNDGDATMDYKKIIGKTGGLYPLQTNSYALVESMIYKAMGAGNGGDGPENNMEALIKGVTLYPDATSIVMIADNWAPVKDIKLLTAFKKPVKIILCGADFGINSQYLDLARATGGSVHTMTSDIVQLAKVNEGTTVKIGKEEFKLVGGKFVRISTGRS